MVLLDHLRDEVKKKPYPNNGEKSVVSLRQCTISQFYGYNGKLT